MRFLRVLGVEPVICPPRRPDKKPFVERCIGTLKHEWFARFSPATLAEAYDVLEQFPDYYNRQRPHQGRACQNRPPDEAFPVLPQLPQLPDSVNPDAWLQHENGRVYRRRINSGGTIQVDRHTYFVSSQLAGQPVLVHLDAERQCFWVTHNQETVKQMPIAGLYQGTMDFASYLRVMQVEARTIEQHHHLMWERTGEIHSERTMVTLLQTLENWIAKHWLALLLAGIFPVWSLLVWVFTSSGLAVGLVGAICLSLPLGYLNILVTPVDLKISSLLMSLVLGFFIGWIVLPLWKWKIWTRVLILGVAILNSCGYVYYGLSRMD